MIVIKSRLRNSLWVIIMVVPCVVIADCKNHQAAFTYEHKPDGFKIRKEGKGKCGIQLVDSNTAF